MIVIMQCYECLACQIHERGSKKAKGEVFRDCRSARNIHRLCEIADADNNMPAVNAIKALELINDEQTNNKQTTSPGITIRIVNIAATPTQHEQTNIAANADVIEASEQ